MINSNKEAGGTETVGMMIVVGIMIEEGIEGAEGVGHLVDIEVIEAVALHITITEINGAVVVDLLETIHPLQGEVPAGQIRLIKIIKTIEGGDPGLDRVIEGTGGGAGVLEGREMMDEGGIVVEDGSAVVLIDSSFFLFTLCCNIGSPQGNIVHCKEQLVEFYLQMKNIEGVIIVTLH